MQQVISTLDLPDGVTLLPSYAGRTNQELQAALFSLGGLAAFLVFVVMAVQYNSLVDPLVIILTVPLALVGGILGLFITQTALGITVVVGAVLLVGIVVNNAIIMIETANQIRSETGVDRHTAITTAAPQRLRPILMTTITTVLGLFPLALGIGEGSEFLQPLGIVVFSGLTLATLLTLFIIPCFYVLLHDIFSRDSGIITLAARTRDSLSERLLQGKRSATANESALIENRNYSSKGKAESLWLLCLFRCIETLIYWFTIETIVIKAICNGRTTRKNHS